MKSYVAKYAYVRQQNPIPADLPSDYPPPNPASVKVAYNRAPEGLCSANLPTNDRKRSLKYPRVLKRQNAAQDIDVVVSGTIVVSSLSQSYCGNTNSPTSPPASTTATQTQTTTTASPSPTVNIDQGILTCGTRTDQGNHKHFFTLGDAVAARREFCGNLTNNDTPIIFKPGTDTYHQYIFPTPDNVDYPILVSAKWNPDGDSGCPTLNASKEGAFQLCEDRVGIPIQNCMYPSSPTFNNTPADFVIGDTKKNGHNFWKQGGRFYRDCITWEIKSTSSASN